MNQLRDQHVLILGLGISGLSMARWCARAGARVTVADTREAPPSLAALREEWPQAVFVQGPFDASLVEGRDVRAVFASPGLAPAATQTVMDAARALGLWTGGELDLFAQALADLATDRNYKPAVLAVTGTNGKTTVTALTGQLVARAGRRVAVAGNIGPALLDTLADALDREPAPEIDGEIAAEPTDVAEGEVVTAPTQSPASEASPEASLDALQETGSEPAADAPAAETALAAGLATEEAAASSILDDGPAPLAPPPIDPVGVFVVLPEVWVIELSSFQLHDVRGFEPTAGTVLNITQDHLDWHGDMNAYAADKSRVFGAKGAMLLNREDPLVMAFQPPPPKGRIDKAAKPREVVTFGGDMPQRPGDWGIETATGMAWLVRAMEADETRRRRKDEEEEIHIQRLMPADALRIRGRHNATNALAALALATAAGCPLAPMLYGLREYRGEPHRVESVGLADGIEYFDDSKGTNVGATVAALQGLGAERKVIAILGGEGKGQDFTPLAAPLSRFARAAVLIGRDAPLIRAAIESSGVQIEQAADMKEAVRLATARAHAGDAVLMSPACASFDMFDNYKHRGEVFRAVVEAQALEAGQTLEAAA